MEVDLSNSAQFWVAGTETEGMHLYLEWSCPRKCKSFMLQNHTDIPKLSCELHALELFWLRNKFSSLTDFRSGEWTQIIIVNWWNIACGIIGGMHFCSSKLNLLVSTAKTVGMLSLQCKAFCCHTFFLVTRFLLSMWRTISMQRNDSRRRGTWKCLLL
jgi:hypothetical protein